ncbi:hypothetical protein MN0502_35110 (plasmid) [Arthrobacter sp. MN05-02]|nr:hypothetical protein MN0502_35110 [Arthrobacter sp. MN05-02]
MLTAAGFGLISAVFFIGYVLFEIPSSVLLQKFGPRKWLARIILTWGIVQALSAWAPNGLVLGICRVLLGICEAGFAPGVLFYLTLWLPARRRAQAFGIFFASAGSMALFGGPLMSALIQWGDAAMLFGLSGWRFMFLVTGLVPVVLGILTLFVLSDHPGAAKWLNREQSQIVASDLAAEQSAFHGSGHSSVMQSLKKLAHLGSRSRVFHRTLRGLHDDVLPADDGHELQYALRHRARRSASGLDRGNPSVVRSHRRAHHRKPDL